MPCPEWRAARHLGVFVIQASKSGLSEGVNTLNPIAEMYSNESLVSIGDALDRAAESDRGVAFYSARGVVEHRLSYRDLRTGALATARRLTAMGFKKGQRLGVIAETSPSFLFLFYACQYAGIVPSPLPFTTYLGGKQAYIDRLTMLTKAARFAAIVTPRALLDCASATAAATGARALVYDDLCAAESADEVHGELPRIDASDPAYIQYSSGSTAEPKGILISQRAVCTNARSIVLNGMRLRSTDRAFSWLPFYHDMGLVGFSIAPLFGPCSVDYLSPSAFARRPRLWLELMSDNGSTITYSPTFGYRLAAQRYQSGGKSIDLSRLRVAGIGGDLIRADVLNDFADVIGETGFRHSAFLPSYGMAEAVLAISFADLDMPPRVDHLEGMSSSYVNCGRPLPELNLLVVDESGQSVPECTIGHIWVRGLSVVDDYVANPEATSAIKRRDGFIDTGDLGYLVDGSIVVTGRSKELILYHGRNIWPQDVEWIVERIEPLKPGDAAAFAITKGDDEQLVVLVQCVLTEESERAALRQRVASAIGEAIGVSARVVLVGPRDLPFTSSGKLARARAKALFLKDENKSGGIRSEHDGVLDG